jgi:murein hydrolase activator
MRFILFKLYLVIFLFFVAAQTFGQSLNDLRKQKEKTAAEIEYINNLLKETNENARSSLNRLAVLEKQIKLQDELIGNITNEIGYLDSSIKISSRKVDSLTSELQTVKNNYAELVRYARRNQNNTSQLLFLLSSNDFNQAYKRFIYLRQYADYRRQQVKRITEVKNTLYHQITDLNSRKEEQHNLLASRVDQTKRIEQQKVKQNEYYTELQQKEKELKKKLESQRRSEANLEHEIEKAIAEEAKKASRKSAKEPGLVLTKEEKALSGDFSNNKGRFPWPVLHGLITDRFGEHPHAALKHVMVRNSGIDITTQANEKARSIFKGEVSKVIAMSDGSFAVIIRHGNYLTVYSNLSEVFVKAGQKVESKEEIGKIYTDKNEDNKTVLKFQLWHQSTKLDPEEWILRQ